MTWKLDASRGFLGRSPPTKPGGVPQPWRVSWEWPDLDEALVAARPALEVWSAFQVADGAPLYSGGVLDAWPAWVVDLLKVARPEWEAVKAWLTWCAQEEVRRGSSAENPG